MIAFCLSILNGMSYYDYVSMFTYNLDLNRFFGPKVVRIRNVYILMYHFSNTVHLACEVSDPPRDANKVARCRTRKRPRVLLSVLVPTVLSNV